MKKPNEIYFSILSKFYILLFPIALLIGVSCSCTAMIKKSTGYPERFIISEKIQDSVYTYYYMDEHYYLYHKRNFAEVNDTLYLKPFLNKYLIIKK